MTRTQVAENSSNSSAITLSSLVRRRPVSERPSQQLSLDHGCAQQEREASSHAHGKSYDHSALLQQLENGVYGKVPLTNARIILKPKEDNCSLFVDAEDFLWSSN